MINNETIRQKRIKRQTIVNKILHRKLNIEGHEHNYKGGISSALEGLAVPAIIWHLKCKFENMGRYT